MTNPANNAVSIINGASSSSPEDGLKGEGVKTSEHSRGQSGGPRSHGSIASTGSNGENEENGDDEGERTKKRRITRACADFYPLFYR